MPTSDRSIPKPHVRGWRFFALTYAWSWACWIPLLITLADLGRLGSLERPERPLEGIPIWVMVFWLLGAYGPSIVALILAGAEGGWGSVRGLLRRLLRWRVGVGWHLSAWLGPTLFLLGGMALFTVGDGSLPGPGLDRVGLVLPAILLAIPFGPLAEELGWRGYALPHLQSRYSALSSSILIGIAWTLWHVPLFFVPVGTTISGSAITVWAVTKYVLALVSASIIMTWIFNHTRGSVLLSLAYHTSTNASVTFFLFPDQSDAVVREITEWSAVPEWTAALILIALLGGARLSRSALPSEAVAPAED